MGAVEVYQGQFGEDARGGKVAGVGQDLNFGCDEGISIPMLTTLLCAARLETYFARTNSFRMIGVSSCSSDSP